MAIYINDSYNFKTFNLLPHTHAQGVAKQSVLSDCLFVSTKIARSGDLGGIQATHTYNRSVEKPTLLCFESYDNAHECRKHWIFIGHTLLTKPTTGHVLSAHAHNAAQSVGKGHL